MADHNITEPTERLRKWQKSLSSTGQSTELLGWMLIVVAPLLLFLQETPKLAASVAIWIAAVLGGLYYIYSGRYIRYKHGKHTTKLLVLNGLATIIIARGVIPIVVLVESWVTYFKYRKENERLKTKTLGAKLVPFAVWQKVLLVLFIVAGGACVVYVTQKASTTSATGGSSASSLTSDTSWRDYTSAEYGFKMSFPGNPTASNSSTDVSGVSIPTTSYERDNGDLYYTVEVVNYPSQFDMSDIDARLEGALNGSVGGNKGATLTTSNFVQFAGYRAIHGAISVPSGGSTTTLYELDFLKGNELFMFITSGASETDFNTFIDSFQFT